MQLRIAHSAAHHWRAAVGKKRTRMVLPLSTCSTKRAWPTSVLYLRHSHLLCTMLHDRASRSHLDRRRSAVPTLRLSTLWPSRRPRAHRHQPWLALARRTPQLPLRRRPLQLLGHAGLLKGRGLCQVLQELRTNSQDIYNLLHNSRKGHVPPT